MYNWYKSAQEAGTPGAPGADVNTGSDPAVEPNPQIRGQEAVDADPSMTGQIDYAALDRQIKNNILKPLYEFYNIMYERGTVIGFKRHLDSYKNVSRLVISGNPNPSLSAWVTQLLYLFPEGDAKIQLQQELAKLNSQAVMQEQTV